jgi:hypothetical protein
VTNLVNAIEAFLQDPSATTLSHRQGSIWWLGLIGALLLVLAVVLFLEQTDCVIDKHAGLVSINRRGLTGRGAFTFPMSGASHFALEQRRGEKGLPLYRLLLVLDDGRTFPFRDTFTSELKWKQTAAGELTKFLRKARAELERDSADASNGGRLKICVLCGLDCSEAPRGVDEANRYYHLACYEAAQRAPHA